MLGRSDASGDFSVCDSEFPALAFHEAFEVQEGDVEVLADVGYPDGVRLEPFHRDDGPADRIGTRDEKRIGVAAALEELLLLDIGLEVRDGIDLTTGVITGGYRRCAAPGSKSRARFALLAVLVSLLWLAWLVWPVARVSGCRGVGSFAASVQ